MSRFIEGQDRQQVTLLPECLDDFIGEDNPVRVIDAFVVELNLGELGFDRTAPAATGRPAYDPAVLLKVYIYGYLNRVQSSRRLEHECQRNFELMWLTGRLAPAFKTIADTPCMASTPSGRRQQTQVGSRFSWQQIRGGGRGSLTVDHSSPFEHPAAIALSYTTRTPPIPTDR